MDVSPHSGEEAQTCPCCLSMKAPIIVALGNPPDPIPTTSLQGTLAVMWGGCDVGVTVHGQERWL